VRTNENSFSANNIGPPFNPRMCIHTNIVSGSVVLVGNTLNWLAYKGRCKVEAIDGDLTDAIEFTGD
jgi:hypothetical protein